MAISPKIEIINHFDKLINKVDIEIDESIQKYNDEQILGQLFSSKIKQARNDHWNNFDLFKLKFHYTINPWGSMEYHGYRTVNLWSYSTKVIDYLNEVRTRTIEELRKEQEESLENYKRHSSHLKTLLTEVKSIDELKSKLFSDKFYFQVHFTQSEERLWAFGLFTFVTDFYMSPSDINLLEKLINAEKEPFSPVKSPVFDEKMVLIGLLYSKFIENFQRFPNQLIDVRKQDVSDVELIYFKHDYKTINLTKTIDLTKLDSLEFIRRDETYIRESVEINLEGFTSLKKLHLEVNSNEINISIRNLPSLTCFGLIVPSTIDENITSNIINQLPNIEKLSFGGNLSSFNLDNLVNLKCLSLEGTLNEDFNFELFKNLCNQLEDLSICSSIENENFLKLFDANFSNLLELKLTNFNVGKLNKEILNRFPILQDLTMNRCNLEVIEDDSILNLKNLVRLNLSENLLETIDKRIFSQLTNLNSLILRKNRIKCIDQNMFSKLENLEMINLSDNQLSRIDLESYRSLIDSKYSREFKFKLNLSEFTYVNAYNHTFDVNFEKIRRLSNLFN